MRTALDAARLLGACLRFVGNYRAAAAVSVVLAVGYLVYHAG